MKFTEASPGFQKLEMEAVHILVSFVRRHPDLRCPTFAASRTHRPTLPAAAGTFPSAHLSNGKIGPATYTTTTATRNYQQQVGWHYSTLPRMATVTAVPPSAASAELPRPAPPPLVPAPRSTPSVQVCRNVSIQAVSDAMQAWLLPHIDKHPIYIRRAQYGANFVTPLGFTVPVARNLLELSILKCEGPSCSNRQAALIALTELLSGVISDPCSRSPPSGTRDDQWMRRHVASSALAHLATIAVDRVACNPPLVLALLNFLAPCIIPAQMRYDKEHLVMVDKWYPSAIAHQNRHLFINTERGFDSLFAPLLQLTSQLACSEKFSPSLISSLYAPENYASFVKWFTTTHPAGTPVPPPVDLSALLSAEAATDMVARRDHALFAYCNVAVGTASATNQRTIITVLANRYPQFLTLCRFAACSPGTIHAFLACAVFWCVYAFDLQSAHRQSGVSQHCVSQLLQDPVNVAARWLAPLEFGMFNLVPTKDGAMAAAVTLKEAMALRLGFYDLALAPDSIIYASAKRGSEGTGPTKGLALKSCTPSLVAFGALYRQLLASRVPSNHLDGKSGNAQATHPDVIVID